MTKPNMIKVAVLVLASGTFTFGPGMAAADTAYVANEATGTISVIETKTRAITATIGLGSDPAIPGTPQPGGPLNAEADHHKPFYNGHVGTHGLWLTPDGAILLVANRISGTIVAVDTATNTVLGYTPVGREPHLATVRPGGREAWVAVRGESHIDVLELDRAKLFNPQLRRTDRMRTIATIDTVRGPSMVTFTHDGHWAFVVAGKQNRVDKIDAETRKVVASQTVPAAFTPFGHVSPDDKELYLIHKGAQKLSILRTSDLSFVVEGMPIGPCANHVWFVGKLTYVTIGGAPPCAPAGSDREGKIVIVDRTTHKIVHELTGPAFTGDPHGMWGTKDGLLYVGHERGNRVTVIKTGKPDDPMDDTVEGTVTGSPQDLAFMKQPIDIVIKP
jgi:YVTN family beta-propeller protein